MDRNIKRKVRFNNTLSEEFSCYVGVRQGECLSPFLFSMYINDLEGELIQNGIDSIDKDAKALSIIICRRYCNLFNV